MPSYSALERQILQAVLAHITQNEELSLTELAEECHASKSTVVKAVQKLGYHGFTDLTRSVRLNTQTGPNTLLPRAIVRGNPEHQIDLFARQLARFRHRKNFIFSGDRRCGALLAAYMSRKLAMFDIFAPASYDYAITFRRSLEPGAAIFCFHREAPRYAHLGQQEGYGEGMLHAAKKAGFFIIALTDEEAGEPHPDIDLELAIAPNEGAGGDFFATRVIVLFENALERFAHMPDDIEEDGRATI